MKQRADISYMLFLAVTALAGSIAGVLCAGVLSDRLGRRRTMLVSAVLFTVSAVGCALCADFTQLVVYRIVGGLGIGVV